MRLRREVAAEELDGVDEAWVHGVLRIGRGEELSCESMVVHFEPATPSIAEKDMKPVGMVGVSPQSIGDHRTAPRIVKEYEWKWNGKGSGH